MNNKLIITLFGFLVINNNITASFPTRTSTSFSPIQIAATRPESTQPSRISRTPSPTEGVFIRERMPETARVTIRPIISTQAERTKRAIEKDVLFARAINLIRGGYNQITKLRNLINENPYLENYTDLMGNNLLHWAASQNNPRLFQFVFNVNMNALANENRRGETPLIVNQNIRGNTPLIIAAILGHVDVVKEILKLIETINYNTIDYINLANNNGRTALHEAAAAGHAQVVAELMRIHANPNAQDFNGDTPATLAERAGHTTVAKLIKALAGLYRPSIALIPSGRSSRRQASPTPESHPMPAPVELLGGPSAAPNISNVIFEPLPDAAAGPSATMHAIGFRPISR